MRPRPGVDRACRRDAAIGKPAQPIWTSVASLRPTHVATTHDAQICSSRIAPAVFQRTPRNADNQLPLRRWFAQFSGMPGAPNPPRFALQPAVLQQVRAAPRTTGQLAPTTRRSGTLPNRRCLLDPAGTACLHRHDAAPAAPLTVRYPLSFAPAPHAGCAGQFGRPQTRSIPPAKWNQAAEISI